MVKKDRQGGTQEPSRVALHQLVAARRRHVLAAEADDRRARPPARALIGPQGRIDDRLDNLGRRAVVREAWLVAEVRLHQMEAHLRHTPGGSDGHIQSSVSTIPTG